MVGGELSAELRSVIASTGVAGKTCTKGKHRLFTEVKLCWTGLITEWVEISVLYSLGSQVRVDVINHASHLYKCCTWAEFQSIST